MNDLDKGIALAAAVTNAIRNGVEHRDVRGRLLETPIEVLEALLDDGEITVKEPGGSA